MCDKTVRSFSEVNGVETPIELSSFILDEIGHLNYQFCCQIPAVARYLGQVVTFKDLSEDG